MLLWPQMSLFHHLCTQYRFPTPPHCLCVLGGGGQDWWRCGCTPMLPVQVDMPPTRVPFLAVPSLGLGPCLAGTLALFRCNRAAPGSTWATSGIMGSEGQQLLLLG